MAEPKIGSKAGPSPEDVKRAQDNKRSRELNVGLFYAAAKSAGAEAITFRKIDGGDEIVIKGRVGSRACEASIGVREGLPFDVHAMACLESFRQGRADHAPPAVDKPWPREPAAEYLPSAEPAPQAQVDEALGVGSACAVPNAPPAAAPAVASSIRTASAIAGTRPKRQAFTDPKTGRKITATGFPECIREGCPQPVAYPGGEFCGGECAKKHHTALAAQRQGVKLP